MVGNFLLALSFIFYIFVLLFFLIKNKNTSQDKIRSLALSIPIFFNLASYGFFAYLFLSHQFEYNYVYQYSNATMPSGLLVASTWAGQAGSVFLWSFFCCFSLLIAYRNKERRRIVVPILLIHQIVLLILIWNSKPFAKSAMLFSDGLGMNPALSHILMIIHPPFAFIGYSFLSLLFAHSLASLILHQYETWINLARKYALIALCSLSTTIVLGSLWAYQVIGWGGYWSFDPIENGTLITCLLLLAFLHAVSLYQKQKIGLKLVYLLSILIYSSVIHMVLLIRSGLLKNLTQHSYSGSGLLYALMFTDILTFILPILFLFFQLKNIKQKKLKLPLLSKSGRNIVIIWLLILMSFILFLDLNQPLLNPSLSLAPTQFTPLLLSLFFSVTLLAYVFLSISSSPFVQSRSIRIHAWGKILVEILYALLMALALATTLNMGFSRETILIILLLFLPSFGIVKAIINLRKLKWYSTGKEIAHIAVCLLLLSVVLTNLNQRTETICLEQNVPYQTKEYSAVLKDSPKTIRQYIGNKEQFSIHFTRSIYQFTTYPSIWTYQRNKGAEKQIIPYIKVLPDIDLVIIPKQKGLKTIKLNQEVEYKGIVLALKELTKTNDTNGQVFEKAIINFQKLTDRADNEPYLEQEDITVIRKISLLGKAIETTYFSSSLLEEKLEWVGKESDDTISVSSDSIAKTFEFDVMMIPYMLLLRLSYFFLLLSLLWMLFLAVFETTLSKKTKEKIK